MFCRFTYLHQILLNLLMLCFILWKNVFCIIDSIWLYQSDSLRAIYPRDVKRCGLSGAGAEIGTTVYNLYNKSLILIKINKIIGKMSYWNMSIIKNIFYIKILGTLSLRRPPPPNPDIGISFEVISKFNFYSTMIYRKLTNFLALLMFLLVTL